MTHDTFKAAVSNPDVLKCTAGDLPSAGTINGYIASLRALTPKLLFNPRISVAATETLLYNAACVVALVKSWEQSDETVNAAITNYIKPLTAILTLQMEVHADNPGPIAEDATNAVEQLVGAIATVATA